LVIESLLTVNVDVRRLRAVDDGRCDVGSQRRETILESLHPADLIDGLASTRRHQPGTRPLRNPVAGPSQRRLDERVSCGIFGNGEVADVAHQRGHQPWPLLCGSRRHPSDPSADQLGRARQPSNSMTGRTSIVPK
jgi:hypothetical protein